MPPWLPIGISILALMISAFSASVAFLAFIGARESSELLVRPVLNTGGPIFEADESVSFVANRGRGSASIELVEFRIDGEHFFGSQLKIRFNEYEREFNKGAGSSFDCEIEAGSFYKGMRIDPEQRVTLFRTSGICPTEMYWPFLQSLSVMFKYSSDRGAIYQMIFMVPTLDEIENSYPLF